jgi:uncharacterized protein (TIGR02996 family)
MSYFEHPRWPALLAAIRANPLDMLPRLVAADHVEECGDADRANFIRTQIAEEAHGLRHTHSYGHPGGCRKCKLWRKCCRWIKNGGWELLAELTGDHGGIWYGGNQLTGKGPLTVEYNGGFVTKVTGSLDVLCQMPCGSCKGNPAGCYRCRGRRPAPPGFTTGVLTKILSREPVVGVLVTGRGPRDFWSHPDGPFWSWSYSEDWERLEVLPEYIFRLCDGRYPTASIAIDALSAAIIAAHLPTVTA